MSACCSEQAILSPKNTPNPVLADLRLGFPLNLRKRAGGQMRVLVTGGLGFIGSALCRYLVGDVGVDVLNVDTLTYAANLLSLDAIARHARYRFRRADICNQTTLEAAF